MNRSTWKLVGCSVLAGVALLLVCAPAFSTVIHVKTSGDDANDGLTWGTAKRTVQAGVDAAAEGDEVWTAAGIYAQTTLNLPSGVALYGGFAGTETEREQRDWDANVTILHGDHTARVIFIAAGATADTRIDGFTIRNGHAQGGDGGGIHANDGAPTIANNDIDSNRADHAGGGIWTRGNAVITSNTIRRNRAEGSYSESDGGGVLCTASASITGNTIRSNVAYDTGGGICATGSASIVDNLITGNTARYAGGVHLAAGVTRDNDIESNTSSYEGGGARITGSGTFSNNIVADNTAGRNGGGVDCPGAGAIISNLFYDNVSSTKGGGIVCGASCLAVTGNTVVRSSAPDGGGISMIDTKAVVANNIVAFNDSGVHRSGGSAWLYNNDVYGNADYDYSGLSAGPGDISEDPLFVDEAADNFHLWCDSPCIDIGEDGFVGPGDVDIDGEDRIYGAHVDMGVDEYWAQLWLEDDDPAITYTGNWSQYGHPAVSGGRLTYSDETAASAELEFCGTGLRWHLAVGPMAGMADVYLDGGHVGRLDLYRSRVGLIAPQRTGLALGHHTVLIEVSGEKNPSSTGYFVDIDALEVVP